MKLRQERAPPLTFLYNIFFSRDMAPFFFHGKEFSKIHYGSSKLKYKFFGVGILGEINTFLLHPYLQSEES
jgi:hypothetical protein